MTLLHFEQSQHRHSHNFLQLQRGPRESNSDTSRRANHSGNSSSLPSHQEQGFCSNEEAPLGRPPFLKPCHAFGVLCHRVLVRAAGSGSCADEEEAEGACFDGRLEAEDDLLCAGGCAAWFITLELFCASEMHSVIASMASPKRPEGDKGALSSAFLSASFSHR